MTPALMLPLALMVPFLGDPLRVPREASILVERVQDALPGGDDVAFAPCGDAKIGPGRRFFRHFFTGEPASGYLVTHVADSSTFLRAMRGTPYEAFVAGLRQAFAGVRLIGVRRQGYDVQAAAPQSVEVDVPRGLHACVSDAARPVCCCCAGCAEGECCEKRLGSASVTVVFRDPLGGASLEYRYAPLGGGRSLLYERTAGGRRTGIRFCLDQPGELAVDW